MQLYVGSMVTNLGFKAVFNTVQVLDMQAAWRLPCVLIPFPERKEGRTITHEALIQLSSQRATEIWPDIGRNLFSLHRFLHHLQEQSVQASSLVCSCNSFPLRVMQHPKPKEVSMETY